MRSRMDDAGRGADADDAARRLLRELRSPQNGRFLRSLAPFRVEEVLPGRLKTLLRRMEEAETRSATAPGPRSARPE